MSHIGPYVLEIMDTNGVVYRLTDEDLMLAGDDYSLHVKLGFSADTTSQVRSRGPTPGQYNQPGPTSADGRVYNWASARLSRVKLTIAGKYFFLWVESEDFPNTYPPRRPTDRRPLS